MIRLKSGLLCATVMAGGFAGVAQAQIVLPPVELRGAGATAVGTIHVGVSNCIGQPGAPGAGLNQYGINTGALFTVVTPNYNPTTPSLSNPVLNCATTEIQPNYEAKYVGTGSGTGRAWWRSFANQLPGTTASNINPFGAWTNVQFAFSEALPSTGDLSTYASSANNYNATTNTTGNQAGPAIIVPLYVLPVAVSYAPAYGEKSGVKLNFNVRSTNVLKDSAGNPVGGIRLTKAAYCGIFNGTITNWNSPVLQTLNGNQSYADTVNGGPGEASRWSNAAPGGGAPIRLVGRLDNSGTSDVFTRHLAAVCPAILGAANKVTTNSGNLPYSTSGGPDMRPFGSTQYFPTAGTTTNTNTFAGTTQSLSGAFFNDATSQIQVAANFTGEQPGLFMVANGNTGVTAAIAEATNTLVTSALDATVKLNGKVGYVSGEFVLPSPGASNFSAAMQVGTAATAFVGPTTTQANSAFGVVLPPQTTASSGAWNTLDGRGLSRANPRDWGLALYPATGATLANPAKGYPITGPSFALLYTCYAPDASNRPAKRLAIAQTVGILLGKVTKKSNNTSLSVNTFKGTGATSLGILTQQNLSVAPPAWQNAINETFLKRSTQSSGGVTLGSLNLWIQSAAPTSATQIDGIGTNDVLSNPACTAPTQGA